MTSRDHAAHRLNAHLMIGFTLILGAALTIQSAAEPTPAETRHFGPAQSLGNGTVRSYVTIDAKGVPTAVGVALSADAMHGLKTEHGLHEEYVLELPETAAATPFRHITLYWNPAGHEPPGIYDLPHFDFHFYTIPNETRLTFTPDRADFAEKGGRVPTAEFVPEGYVLVPDATVPLMGTHWADPAAPELNGKPFTKTFLHGSWDGQLIFYEPMITREWLMSGAKLVEPLKLPARYPSAGHWPTTWSVNHDTDAREYRVELGGFVHRHR